MAKLAVLGSKWGIWTQIGYSGVFGPLRSDLDHPEIPPHGRWNTRITPGCTYGGMYITTSTRSTHYIPRMISGPTPHAHSCPFEWVRCMAYAIWHVNRCVHRLQRSSGSGIHRTPGWVGTPSEGPRMTLQMEVPGREITCNAFASIPRMASGGYGMSPEPSQRGIWIPCHGIPRIRVHTCVRARTRILCSCTSPANTHNTPYGVYHHIQDIPICRHPEDAQTHSRTPHMDIPT
jgi:hypothetical protein